MKGVLIFLFIALAIGAGVITGLIRDVKKKTSIYPKYEVVLYSCSGEVISSWKTNTVFLSSASTHSFINTSTGKEIEVSGTIIITEL